MPEETDHKHLTSDDAQVSDIDPFSVICNIYDIVPMVNTTSRFLRSQWGVYHTGIQVHGLEVSFGGHADSSTGVFCARPRTAQGCVFREALVLGSTTLDAMEFRQKVAEVAAQWPGNSYDPFGRNCNHFAGFFAQELVGKSIPSYINEFTKSPTVRGIFHGIVKPMGRCLEMWYDYGGITYAEDAEVSNAGAASDLGISGARGVNQVLVEAATTQKQRANELFKEGHYYDEARAAYKKALGYLSTLSHRTDDEDEICNQAQSVRMALLLNSAACDLKQKQYSQAVDICSEVLLREPSNLKAKYRRGIAASYLGNHEQANDDLRSVLHVAEQQNDTATIRDARRELARVKNLVEAEKQKDKSLAKKMMGLDDSPI
mmetsp:Transcript_89526/g.187034  ORF Transcript_89526/g.187034 Transcript_89526/m.187034 type:complete len:374 (-) Transcript_89526:195-1316(-)